MRRLLYVIAQCTWGIVQTALGLLIFLVNIRRPHRIYRGCIDTHWKSRGGMSLGLFIFTPGEDGGNSRPVRVHEYGHTIQSLILGPLYLIIVGIVSYTWANLPYFRRMRKEKGVPYTACFVESWASRLGEKVTGEPAIWH
ncbi:MAG: hypothetical protein E7554_05595 [Ruminococcaceae bacterium]|nr:hypothetical protein [Oscillospiraceae bacterium]